MHPLVHLLTAAAIMLHATLGCCAHGSHATNYSDDESITPCQASCCQHLSPAENDSNSRSEKSAPHDCCHDHCIWPAPELRLNVDLLESHFAICIHAIQNATAVEPLCFAIEYSQGLNFSPYDLPVRTHLAKNVLLI